MNGHLRGIRLMLYAAVVLHPAVGTQSEDVYKYISVWSRELYHQLASKARKSMINIMDNKLNEHFLDDNCKEHASEK